MAKNPKQIVLVHSDETERTRLAEELSAHFGWCSVATSIEELGARSCCADAIVLQAAAADPHRLDEWIERVRTVQPLAHVIVLAPAGDASTIRQAFLAGARDCIPETTPTAELLKVIEQAAHRGSASPPCEGGASAPAIKDNRTYLDHGAFLEALADLRQRCRRLGQPVTLVLTNLDRFRECNDRFSPAFADGVLRWFAMNLRSVSPPNGIVARLGSDRFAIAIPGERADKAGRRAKRLHCVLHDNPVRFEDRPFDITASIGIAESSDGFVETEQQLMHRARIAMESAKRQGGNRTITWSAMIADQQPNNNLQHLSPDSVDHWMRRAREQLRSTYVESTQALVAAAEARDPHTRAHSVTVCTYAETIARRMGLGSAMIETLRAAALLHDIGKIGIPDTILTKPGPLTDEEYDIVKHHPQIAIDILQHASYLENERPLILHHHERFDGTGYPDKLKGDEIPIGARILAMADALDVMFSSRSYKPPYTLERVRAELQAEMGKQFDPAITATTLQWLDTAPDFATSATTHGGANLDTRCPLPVESTHG